MNYVIGKNSVNEVKKHCPERILEDFSYESKDQLSKRVGTDSHQGAVLLLRPREFLPLKKFFERNASTVLMLDSIFDPQNFGAILRAAECFGVDAVVFSKNRGVGVTPVVTKAAVGATELVPLIRVSNLAQVIGDFQDHGYSAYTAEINDEAQALNKVDFPEKRLLIMGSEGRGVQPLLSKKADGALYLPMRGKIDSLNVSQATAVFLSEFMRNQT